jgi:hypothetical protein
MGGEKERRRDGEKKRRGEEEKKRRREGERWREEEKKRRRDGARGEKEGRREGEGHWILKRLLFSLDFHVSVGNLTRDLLTHYLRNDFLLQTPLHLSTFNDDPEVKEILLRNGANINEQTVR